MGWRSRSGGGAATPPHLPSLGSDPGAGARHSASLRSSHHKKLPEIADRPLNTLLPRMRDGSIHPEPYYVTINVVWKMSSHPPPWLTAQKQSEIALLDFWRNNGSFQERYLMEFIKDAIFVEVSGMCSGLLAEGTARNKEEAQMMSYLDNFVITVEVYFYVEEIVWEVLWDMARKMGKRDAGELESIYGEKEIDSQTMKVLRDNYTRPIRPSDGQPILYHKVGMLLFHLHRLMQRGSLMQNYAIKTLQEQIICQVAAKVVLDEALRFMEDEMASMDEEERVENPPRQG